MRKKELEKQLEFLKNRISDVISDNLFIGQKVETALIKADKLEGHLVEAGILETNWKPEAPKGSSIKPNVKSFEPSYTKINKVWE